MVDSAERLINLALYLAGSAVPVTAEDCRIAGLGYPEGQDDAAFARMFERDKKTLRAAGLALDVVRDAETESYRLDADAYAVPVSLTAAEVSSLSAAGAAMLTDPSFPLADDLRYALAKVSPATDGGMTPRVAGRLADESPERQGETAATLTAAVASRKRVTFGYTNLGGRGGTRQVDPYGLFLREGRWYLVGRDCARDEVRTYTLARMRDLSVNAERPGTADFQRPDAFDIAAYVLLPFQYGELTHDVTVRFAAEAAWRALAITASQGTFEPQPDGSVLWHVPVADEARLLRWIVENGPGLTPADPVLRRRLADGLRKVVALHAAH